MSSQLYVVAGPFGGGVGAGGGHRWPSYYSARVTRAGEISDLRGPGAYYGVSARVLDELRALARAAWAAADARAADGGAS